MALLTDYSADNMITERGLAIRYGAQRVKINKEIENPGGGTATESVWMWKISRYATKTYSFVGMTYDAAVACADDKEKQYRRLYSRGEDTIVESGASVEVVRDGDSSAYSVAVQVSETDVLLREKYDGNPQMLFAAQNGRNYDNGDPKSGGGEYDLLLTAIHRTGGALDGLAYFANLADFRNDYCIVRNIENNITSPIDNWSGGAFADLGLGDMTIQLEYKRYARDGTELEPLVSNSLTIPGVQSSEDTGAAEYDWEGV